MQDNQSISKQKHQQHQKSSELDKFKLFFEYATPGSPKGTQIKQARSIRRRNT